MAAGTKKSSSVGAWIKEHLKYLIPVGLVGAALASIAIVGVCKWARNNDLSKTVGNLKDTNQSLQGDNQNLQDQNENLKGENDQLNNQIGGLQGEIDDLKEQLKDNPGNKELQDKIDELERELANQNPVQELNFSKEQLKEVGTYLGNTGNTIKEFSGFNYEGEKLSMYFKAKSKAKKDVVVSISVNAKDKSFDQDDVLQWLEDASREDSISKRPDVSIYKAIENFDLSESDKSLAKAMSDKMLAKRNTQSVSEQVQNGAENITVDPESQILYAIKTSTPSVDGSKAVSISTLYITHDAEGNIVYVENKNEARATITGTSKEINMSIFKSYANNNGVTPQDVEITEESEVEA